MLSICRMSSLSTIPNLARPPCGTLQRFFVTRIKSGEVGVTNEGKVHQKIYDKGFVFFNPFTTTMHRLSTESQEWDTGFDLGERKRFERWRLPTEGSFELHRPRAVWTAVDYTLTLQIENPKTALMKARQEGCTYDHVYRDAYPNSILTRVIFYFVKKRVQEIMIKTFSNIECTQESLNLTHVSDEVLKEAKEILKKDGIRLEGVKISRCYLEHFKNPFSSKDLFFAPRV